MTASSAIFHVIFWRSELVKGVALCFDLTGVILCTVGATNWTIFLGFACAPRVRAARHLRPAYWVSKHQKP